MRDDARVSRDIRAGGIHERDHRADIQAVRRDDILCRMLLARGGAHAVAGDVRAYTAQRETGGERAAQMVQHHAREIYARLCRGLRLACAAHARHLRHLRADDRRLLGPG
ncbi:hypothetical protein SDC9_112821 [bioreactor metagenome]|uniref:Uncharacterized protein n=1 Tax=bioreactor metagenome TaxID=1076179 RepID=A0A645BKS8_9ZZZZ